MLCTTIDKGLYLIFILVFTLWYAATHLVNNTFVGENSAVSGVSSLHPWVNYPTDRQAAQSQQR